MNDENDEAKPLVIYHANCADGFTAAWCARRYFGGRDVECDFFAANHGTDPPDVAGRRVFILDFTYKRDAMIRIADEAASLVVLDHHVTALDELDGFPDRDDATIRIDVEKSGARLAWEFFFPDEEPPPLVRYVEDRDLWKFELPSSKPVNAAIGSYRRVFEIWDELDYRLGLLDLPGGTSSGLVAEGIAINRYKDAQVDAICRGAREVEIGGYKVLAANTPVLPSEVAGRLAKGRPFGATWFLRADGVMQWSLRSTDRGVDVSVVARALGGGGHRNAAGFQERGAS